jgi:hypothetical protein
MMRFLRDMQNALQADLPLYKGPFGEPGGGSFAGTFQSNEQYIWVPFLDSKVIRILSMSEALASRRHIYQGSFFMEPEDIKKLSIEVIWNFVKGTGLL